MKGVTPHLVELLAERLSGSELNSLLLEVFSKRGKNISPALLLQQYRNNRFVHPAGTDMIEMMSLKLRTLECLRDHHFQPLELSPAAQWGSCSLLGPVDQKKIVSATRNTEIMADATNTLALHIADCRKYGLGSSLPGGGPLPPADGPLRFCTVHRHVRAQGLKERHHTAHFSIGCMVSGDRDKGSFHFECNHLREHILALDFLFRKVYGIQKTRFKLQRRDGYMDSNLLLQRVMSHLSKECPGLEITREDPPEPNNYYKGIQYKMFIEAGGQEIEIADGGYVDWTQQLLENKKERLLISGFGLDLVYKLQVGML